MNKKFVYQVGNKKLASLCKIWPPPILSRQTTTKKQTRGLQYTTGNKPSHALAYKQYDAPVNVRNKSNGAGACSTSGQHDHVHYTAHPLQTDTITKEQY
jgi:hypothetical protein